MSFFSDNDLIDSFLNTYQTPTTKKTVGNVIRSFLNISLNLNLIVNLYDVNEDVIRQFIAEKSKTALFNTVNQYLMTLKSFVRFLYKKEVISSSVRDNIIEIKSTKGSRPPSGRTLKTKEINKIKSNYSLSNNTIDIRDFAIFSLETYGGIRRCEVSRINIKDIDGTKVHIRGKGNKHRTIYLSKFAAKAISRWLNESRIKSGALFRGVGRWGTISSQRLGVDGVAYAINRVKRKTDLRHFTSHDLRRTFATSLLDNNADVLIVQNLMGHASIDTTKIYDRRPERAKRQAIKLLPY